jgi:hypothetical protein
MVVSTYRIQNIKLQTKQRKRIQAKKKRFKKSIVDCENTGNIRKQIIVSKVSDFMTDWILQMERGRK